MADMNTGYKVNQGKTWVKFIVNDTATDSQARKAGLDALIAACEEGKAAIDALALAETQASMSFSDDPDLDV